jgi:hypothetical protein
MNNSWNIRQRDLNRHIGFSSSGLREMCNDAARLSVKMRDEQSMRRLVHEDNEYAKQVIGIFREFYKDGDEKRAVRTFCALVKQCNDDVDLLWEHIGMFWLDVMHKTICSNEELNGPSVWLDRKNYNDKVAKVLDKLYFDLYEPSCRKPQDRGLRMLDVYRKLTSDEGVKLAADYDLWVSGYRETNGGIIRLYDGDKRQDLNETANNVGICRNLTMRLVQHVDYPFQFGWHKSELFEEIMKLSYLTTFDLKPISMQGMSEFVGRVQNAGHWRRAAAVATREIVENTANVFGINDALIRMHELRPNNCAAAAPYYLNDKNNLRDNLRHYTR